MSLRANTTSGRLWLWADFRSMPSRLFSFAALFVATFAAGCSLAPPRTSDGLPRVSRYTNTTQLDWMLASYRQAAGRAFENAVPAEFFEEACLGWERTVFDLESARLYPVIFRMSTDAKNLAVAMADLDAIVKRHPRPAVCESDSYLHGEGSFAGGAGAAASADAANAPSAAGPPTAAPPKNGTQGPAYERQLLARLRVALGLSVDWQKPGASATAEPAIDLGVLEELARSEVPTIRLRARFHLLGQCVLAVEQADRDFSTALQAAPIPSAQCASLGPNETLRMAQTRLQKSMLLAWRGRHLEPMSDLAVGLAYYAARDNPPLDGPRLSR